MTPLSTDAADLFSAPVSGSWVTLVGVPADIPPPGPFEEGGSDVVPIVTVFAVALASVVTVIVAIKRRPPR